MEIKDYMGDKIIELARISTSKKVLDWGRIPFVIVDKLRNQIPGEFEDGFIGTFRNYQEKSNLILIKTKSNVPNKRYILAFYEIEAGRATVFPPSEFSDSVYVSGIVALYQMVADVVYSQTDENLKKQVSLLFALLEKENQCSKPKG